MKVKSESEVAWSCLTLSDPMDCSLLGSSIHRIFQAGVLEWGAIAFSDISVYILDIHLCFVQPKKKVRFFFFTEELVFTLLDVVLLLLRIMCFHC